MTRIVFRRGRRFVRFYIALFDELAVNCISVICYDGGSCLGHFQYL